MAKRDNNRFKDAERAGRPKRSGKNRRDYGDSSRRAVRGNALDHGDSSRRAVRGNARDYGDSSRNAVRGNARTTRDTGRDYEFSNAVGNDGLEIVSGRNPVLEALRGSRRVERVFIANGAEGSISQIVAIAREQGAIIDYVDKDRINAMAPGEKHQGVVAKVSAYEYAELDDVFDKAEQSGEAPLVVILDEVSDPHNLGAIIRTAECVGAHGVIIPKRRACTLTQTVALAAAGAIESMPVVQVTNLSRTIDDLKKRGLWVAAVDMDGENYYSCELDGPIAIVIGNEGKGISRLVKESCDFTLGIPMRGKINSLNASNAAAIILYGIRRSRDLGSRSE